jgi:hypothetical protein
MNNDHLMMMWLMDNGAFLDYRVVILILRQGDKDQWKTPLHLAALNNKTVALKVLYYPNLDSDPIWSLDRFKRHPWSHPAILCRNRRKY